MIIEMFNGWYFLWIFLCSGATVGLYFALRKASARTQNIVLFSLLALGLAFHFLKIYIPPYSLDEARMLRDAWFVNICGANIALFPFFFLTKNKYLKDYMFYIGVLSGLIAIFYPEEPMAKIDQLGEFWDIVRFYYHHWMLLAVPLLLVLLKRHKLSYKRVLTAPIGALLLMLFIMLNQILQSELGFIDLRGSDMMIIGYKNSSYIWGPNAWLDPAGETNAIGGIFALFCPAFFTKIPVGKYAGQKKYWPWFWMIFPVFILVTPLAFGLCMIFDHKQFASDVRVGWGTLRAKAAVLSARVKQLRAKKVTVQADTVEAENKPAVEEPIVK